MLVANNFIGQKFKIHSSRIHLQCEKVKRLPKDWSHKFLGSLSPSSICMLEAHTDCDQYSRKHQNLVAYTCGGQNSREHSKMLVAYICGRQMSQRMTSYFPQRVFSHSWGKLTPLRHLHSLTIYLKRPKHQISTYSTK